MPSPDVITNGSKRLRTTLLCNDHGTILCCLIKTHIETLFLFLFCLFFLDNIFIFRAFMCINVIVDYAHSFE